MADTDSTIGDLSNATSIESEDLFVIEQSGTAKHVKGSVVKSYAQSVVAQIYVGDTEPTDSTVNVWVKTDGSAMYLKGQDGAWHGISNIGIPGSAMSSIEKTSTSGLIDTYTVYRDDGTEAGTFTVTNGADGTGQVNTVNEVAPDSDHNVNIYADDIFYEEGNIGTVKDFIDELDSGKLDNTGGTVTGNLTVAEDESSTDETGVVTCSAVKPRNGLVDTIDIVAISGTVAAGTNVCNIYFNDVSNGWYPFYIVYNDNLLFGCAYPASLPALPSSGSAAFAEITLTALNGNTFDLHASAQRSADGVSWRIKLERYTVPASGGRTYSNLLCSFIPLRVCSVNQIAYAAT